MNLVRIILGIISLTVVGACATLPEPREVERTFHIDGSTVDDLWPAVIETFGSRSWAIDNMERASGLITTDWMHATDPSWMDCGNPGMGGFVDRMVRFNVFVRSASEGTDLSINTSFRTTRTAFEGPSVGIDCVSTGVLEMVVRDEILARVD